MMFVPLSCPHEGLCSQPLWQWFAISSYSTFPRLKMGKLFGTSSSTVPSRPFKRWVSILLIQELTFFFHCHSKYSDLHTLMIYLNTNMTWLAKKPLSGSLLCIGWMNFTTESLVMSVNYIYISKIYPPVHFGIITCTHFCHLHLNMKKNLNFSFEPLSVDSVSSLTFSWILTFQCYHVPYSALTMFISSEQAERDSATAYREYRCSRVKLEYPVLSHMAKLPSALPSLQGWRSRFWALCSVQPSRGRSSAWPTLPAYQDPVTSS